MFELNGKYGTAKVFTNNCEQEAIAQITNLLNQELVKGQKVRIMSDVHAGAGCTIGTTMTLADKAVPNLVGVDIGCGMRVSRLSDKEIDLAKLDEVIRKTVPSGFAIRCNAHELAKTIDLSELCCKDAVNLDRAYKSLGTLGGGNHFIELNKTENNELYLVIHSGSRHLGVEVAKYYQNAAYADLCEKGKADKQAVINNLIVSLKEQGRQSEIQSEITKISCDFIPAELAYCEGELFKQYIHDMQIVQRYADLNRQVMTSEILSNLKLASDCDFTTVHNYIDCKRMMLRKGAVSAQAGEKLIIPMNMRDGSLICIGKGNEDWNCSAPHGAGRLMSRSKAKELIKMEDFQQSMDGIYSTSVCTSTIDEAPMAYKPMQEILENIKDTVEVVSVIKPVYNFKAS